MIAPLQSSSSSVLFDSIMTYKQKQTLSLLLLQLQRLFICLLLLLLLLLLLTSSNIVTTTTMNPLLHDNNDCNSSTTSSSCCNCYKANNCIKSDSNRVVAMVHSFVFVPRITNFPTKRMIGLSSTIRFTSTSNNGILDSEQKRQKRRKYHHQQYKQSSAFLPVLALSVSSTGSNDQDQDHDGIPTTTATKQYSTAAAAAAAAAELPPQPPTEPPPTIVVPATNIHNLFLNFVDYIKIQQNNIIYKIETSIESKSGIQFTTDPWGCFLNNNTTTVSNTTTFSSGGITRVIQGGDIIEKGACSITIIQNGILTSERASTIVSRQQQQQPQNRNQNQNQNENQSKPSSSTSTTTIKAGDRYSAAALSIVFHTRSPFIPTFRSDVRMFVVDTTTTTTRTTTDTTTTDTTTTLSNSTNNSTVVAWFGGGADLTPYYIHTKTIKDGIQQFHRLYSDLCTRYLQSQSQQPQQQQQLQQAFNTSQEQLQQHFTYKSMKQCCDDYFYLPARSEHRGVGGIFFDDMIIQTIKNTTNDNNTTTISKSSNNSNNNNSNDDNNNNTNNNNDIINYSNHPYYQFVQGMVETWMESWIPTLVVPHQQQPGQLNNYTNQQKQWQKIRRGRYLEFNLLYDRGVKFGLMTSNPRVEGVMVSAPPEISYVYNYPIEPNSPEEELVNVLKKPIDWI